jgi:TonB-linked SusC/RagA family outer membrane protein
MKKKWKLFHFMGSEWSKIALIMKLSLVLIFIGLVNVNAEVFSQDLVLSVTAKNQKLEKVLQQIEADSKVRFFFHREQVDVDRLVSIDVKDENIEEVLELLFENEEVVYRILENKMVVLLPANAEEKMKSISLQQESVTVTGRVSDHTGEALPGVNVYEKGNPQNGVITGIDGSYSIKVESADAVIVYTFIGFENQEISVAGRTEIEVTLVEETTGLNEVVVIGYGTQKKVNLTGSVISVKSEELNNIPAANLSNTLAGRAPGVQVVGNSGLAGATSRISIRGGGTPLFIIDGVERDQASFNALDANEVESINFLKDAASAAVYGSKAGNGVVLITTKSGQKQAPKFEVKSSFSTSRTTYPVQSYTATEELRYINNMMITRGQEAPYGPDIFDYFKDKSYDINDLIWQNPSVQQHNLSVDGGTEKLSYYLALGYHTEEGSYHNTDYDRYNFRSNVTAKITDRFKINVNLSGNQRNYSRWYWPYDGASDQVVSDWYRATFNWTRLYPFYTDAQGNPTNDPNDFPVRPAGGYHPPEIMLHGGYRDSKHRTLDGIIRFDLDLGEYINGLSASFQGHLNAYDMNMKSYVVHNKWYVFQPASTDNKFVPGPIDFTKTAGHTLSASYPNIQESVNLSSSYQINWYLNYQRTFGNHEVSALAVYEQSEYKGKGLYGRAEDLLSTDIDQIYNASGDAERRHFDGGESESARASWIGRANYSFASKYILDFSFRYDGNYRFAPDKRWGFFPSLSAAWRLSEENFLKDNVSWLSNLKLRGSYGTTGSDIDITTGQPIIPWAWTNKYTKAGGYMFGSSWQDGLQSGIMPNKDITWETIKTWNLGLEFGLLDSKLTGEFDVWGSKRTNILGERQGTTPTSLGADLPKENYAQISYSGVELMASYKNRYQNLNYEIYGNMGYDIDQWDIWDEPEAYTDGTYAGNWQSRIGQPLNRVYGLICEGMIRTQEDLDALPEGYLVYGRDPQIGTLYFRDIRGQNYSEGPDGKIDNYDMTYLSDNGKPRINFGFGTNLEWKGISLNAHFQGVGAYDRMVRNRNGWGVFQVDRPYFELWADNYWTPETPNAKYPRVAGNWMQAEYGGNASSFWIRNGAYLRLKNLNIAYALPQNWYERIGIDKVQFFVNGTNLFVITACDEYDPEQETLDSYPLMKTFTGGLSINF